METRIIGTMLRDFSGRRILGDIWYACSFAPSNLLPRLNPYYSGSETGRYYTVHRDLMPYNRSN